MTADRLDLDALAADLRGLVRSRGTRTDAVNFEALVERAREIEASALEDARVIFQQSTLAAPAMGHTTIDGIARAIMELADPRHEVAQITAERDAAQAALARVEAAHIESRPGEYGSSCRACAVTWPCATIRAVKSEGQEAGE